MRYLRRKGGIPVGYIGLLRSYSEAVLACCKLGGLRVERGDRERINAAPVDLFECELGF